MLLFSLPANSTLSPASLFPYLFFHFFTFKHNIQMTLGIVSCALCLGSLCSNDVIVTLSLLSCRVKSWVIVLLPILYSSCVE